MAELSLGQQMKALVTRLKGTVPAFKSVSGLEDLEDAMATEQLLPAAIVIYSGDYQQASDGPTEYWGRNFIRYWSVILVLELTRGPEEGLDLVEAVRNGLSGWRPCADIGHLNYAGAKYINRYDRSRVVYEVRFGIHDDV